jgi:hypothetical protein
MRLRSVVLIGVAILAIGFAGGFYLSLLLERQLILLGIAAIAFAFLTWIGSGADLIGLFRDVVKQTREEETRRKTAIYAELEPLFTNIHKELYLALEAYNQSNAIDYSSHLVSFEKTIDRLIVEGRFDRQVKWAPEVYDEFLAIRERIQDSFRNNNNYGRLISERELAPHVQGGIREIVVWFRDWDKWR